LKEAMPSFTTPSTKPPVTFAVEIWARIGVAAHRIMASTATKYLECLAVIGTPLLDVCIHIIANPTTLKAQHTGIVLTLRN
jgi:hypothetical protein